MATGFSVDISQVVKGLEKEKQNAEKVIKSTVNDAGRNAPAWVSAVVREEYNIKAKEIKSAVRVKSGGEVRLAGTKVYDMRLTYSGRVLGPTHFGMTPKNPPKTKRPYVVKATFKVGRKAELHGKPNYAGKVFVQTINGGTTAFQRVGEEGKGDEKTGKKATARTNLYALRSISIPQMIENGKGETKPRIVDIVNQNFEKRFKHYCERFLSSR